MPDDPVFIRAVSGALLELTYARNWEQFGTLTPVEQATAFDEVYVEFSKSRCAMKAVGEISMWLDVVPPSNYLKCDGGAYYVAEWPELFDLWGYRYGGSGAQFATPDLEDWSPMGAGGVVGLNDFAGSITHTLTVDQMPSHSHAPGSPHTNFFGFRSGGTNTAPAGSALGVMAATAAAGGGMPHNNLHSVFGCNYIVYAGRQV